MEMRTNWIIEEAEKKVTLPTELIKAVRKSMTARETGSRGSFSPGSAFLAAFIVVSRRNSDEKVYQIRLSDLATGSEQLLAARQPDGLKQASGTAFLKIEVSDDHTFSDVVKKIDQAVQVTLPLNKKFEKLFFDETLQVVITDDPQNGCIEFSMFPGGVATTVARVAHHTVLPLPDVSPKIREQYIRVLHKMIMDPGLKISAYGSDGKDDMRGIVEQATPDTPGQHTASLKQFEDRLIQFCEELLNTQGITAKDNFFHIGGHSLHVMQLKMFIKKEFNADISVKTIFETPVIEKLVACIAQKAQPSDNGSPDNGRQSEAPDMQDARRQEATDQPLEESPFQAPLSENGQFHPKAHQSHTGDLVPLSHSEKRLWFLYRFQENKATYNVIKAYRILGKLDVTALEKAFKQLILRHDNLRKTFLEIDGEPWAQVHHDIDIGIRKTDLTSYAESPGILSKLVEKLTNQETDKPFDLFKDLPFRINLLKINAKEHILLINLHHIITDGWSFTVLNDELELFYKACLSGDKVDLPPLEDYYRDYAKNQEELLTEENIKELLDYWKGQLSGKVGRLKLPYSPQAKDDDEAECSTEEIIIPNSLQESLTEMCKEKDVTLFMTFLAGFHSLLHIYTQHEHITTAIPIAGRQHEDSRNLIGFFVNTLILSNTFTEDPNFEEILDRVRGLVLDAYQYQDLPFNIIASELRKDIGISSDDLTQVMFAYQNNRDLLSLPDLKIKAVPVKYRYAKFDLTVSIAESKKGLKVSVEYKVTKFEPSTIKGMLRYYQKLLKSMARNPKLKLSEVDLLSKQEKETIIRQWNNTAKVIPNLTINELFEMQAGLTPNATAIIYDDHKRLTYKELNQRANQLAYYLMSHKVAPEEPIGILMEETEEAIVSILAVLKAGCAYLPLDPAYPKERVLYMLSNSKAKFIISSSLYGHLIPDSGGFKIILLDRERSAILRQNKKDPERKYSADHLAYIMYTSGSTGKPKAVGIGHRSVVRLVINSDYVKITQSGRSTRLLKTGAFSFDASTFEVWGMLLNGGELYLYPSKKLLDPQFFKEKLESNNISLIFITTSWFHLLVEIDPSAFRPLHSLMVGGDKLSARHINKVMSINPDVQLYNIYGPTENTTFSACYKIEDPQHDPIPIGKPITNSTAYILNKSLNLLPPGIEGEIYVGGLGVARGYIGDDERTKEKFLPDPFNPGGRLYKTGDSGKWLEDGNITFVGRKDNQVKLRGYRIEIGEIESAIAQHHDIQEVQVQLHEQALGQKQLVAFYISTHGSPIADLRAFLETSLPEYMIPSQLIWLKEFPLNTNGKVDKSKLAAYIKASTVPANVHESPQNQTEEKLAKIWEDVLSQQNISVMDNFFLLGGHSLLAIKLMSKIEAVFDRKFPLSILFEAPTIRQLALLITREVKQNDSYLVGIQPNGNETPLFVIPGYLFYYNLAKYLGNDQPLYGFEPIPGKTTKETAAFYVQQMRRIQPEGPYLIGGYCAGGITAYEMAQQLIEAGQTVSMLALFEAYGPDGVVSKTSGRYIGEKIRHLKNNFVSASLGEKVKLVRKESMKIFKYARYKLNSIVNSNYSIKPYTGPITLFKADEDMVGSANDPYMGWSKYCSLKNLEIIEVPGNHDTIFKEPNVKIISSRLKECINKTKKQKHPEMSFVNLVYQE